jgi:hypothetical protein
MVFAEFGDFGLEMCLRSIEHYLFLLQTLILVREVLVPDEPLLRIIQGLAQLALKVFKEARLPNG